MSGEGGSGALWRGANTGVSLRVLSYLRTRMPPWMVDSPVTAKPPSDTVSRPLPLTSNRRVPPEVPLRREKSPAVEAQGPLTSMHKGHTSEIELMVRAHSGGQRQQGPTQT
jgi:hypothetical protein